MAAIMQMACSLINLVSQLLVQVVLLVIALEAGCCDELELMLHYHTINIHLPILPSARD